MSTAAKEERIPETDIVFAITATSSRWNNNLQHMKDAITSILDTFSMDLIRVGVIVFGGEVDTSISIQSNLDNSLQADVGRLLPKFGVPDLKSALSVAKNVFQTSGRTNARKVIVVISDRRSGSSQEDIEAEVDRLTEENIVLISVVVGNEADPKELKKFTPHEVTKTTPDENPKELGEKIIILVLKGKKVLIEYVVKSCNIAVQKICLFPLLGLVGI